ncbi:MAG: DUF342 domain-containing protein [Desulfuromonadaceae bacterium]|nr:DUF342 domain-containing protein [Desulfuromonadaceae bacterium]
MKIHPDTSVEQEDDKTHEPTVPESTSDQTEEEQTESGQVKQPVLTAENLIDLLNQLGINQQIDFEAVYLFSASIAKGIEPDPTVLVRGTPPQKGENGWLELKIKIEGGAIELKEDETGQIDHKKLHRFTEIEPEQKLAVVHSPRKGIPGATIHGLPLAAEDGDPFQLIAGEGVYLKFNDRVAFASKAGKALLDNNTLKVVDLLTISGDVDLTVGDINFNGFVEIKGDVPDDFDVRAGKGLLIQGTVGACQIDSGGDIIMGSMAGMDVGTIICHGNLTARFLNQVTVYCYGDVLVEREIRNCRVKATGRIIVERGPIIGGRCIAYSGIEAQEIGAPSGITTQVSSGLYFPDEDRFLYLQKRQRQIKDQISSINNAIEPLETLILRRPEMAETAKKRLDILLEQLTKLQDEKFSTETEIQSSTRQTPDGCNPKINIHKKLYEGVEIELGHVTEVVKQELRGPVSIIENRLTGQLCAVSLSELSQSGQAISAESRTLTPDAESKPAENATA